MDDNHSNAYQTSLLISSIVDVAKNLGLVSPSVDPNLVTSPEAILLADNMAKMSTCYEPTPFEGLQGNPNFWYTVQCTTTDNDDWYDMCDPQPSLWHAKMQVPEFLNPHLKYRIQPWERLTPIPVNLPHTQNAAAA